MMNRIRHMIQKIRDHSDEIINSIAKGAIYGNYVNCVGGGVGVGGAL